MGMGDVTKAENASEARVKIKSLICRVCGKRVRTRMGSSFSNRSFQYPANHKNADGKLCDGWSAGVEWHLAHQQHEGTNP